MTGTPIAFRRGYICIAWERNLVPVIRSNSELCSEGFPPVQLLSHSVVSSLSEPGSSNPCHLQWNILNSSPFCLPYTCYFLHQHRCVVFVMTPLVQVSGDTELCVRMCWSVHGLYLTQFQWLQWNYSWFTLVQKNPESGPRTTGLCPNRPLHKVNHKKSVHSVSNLLNKLLQFTVLR